MRVLLVDHGQERQRYPKPLAQPADPLDLAVDGMPVVAAHFTAHTGRHHLQDTTSRLGHRGHQSNEFVLVRVRSGHGLPARAAMSGGAPE